jgi:hypothetical protein
VTRWLLHELPVAVVAAALVELAKRTWRPVSSLVAAVRARRRSTVYTLPAVTSPGVGGASAGGLALVGGGVPLLPGGTPLT